MANVKITDLPVYTSITSPASDVLPIVDVTTNITKKVSVSTLLAGTGGSGTVTNFSLTGALANAFLVSTPTTTPSLSIQNATSASTQFLRADGTWSVPTGSGVGLSSVGLSMPNSFTVSNSPLTVNGTINVVWGSGLVPVANLGTGTPNVTTFLNGLGQWAVPSGTGTGLTSVGLSMPNAFTVSNSPLTVNGTLGVTWGTGLVPVANLGAGTPSGTNFLRGDGVWATPSGGGSSSGNISSGLNIYNSTLAGTGLTGIDLTINAATVTLTSPSTIGLNGTWTLSAALPNGFTTGDIIIFNTSDRAIVGIGTYTVTSTPSYTITGVIYDPTTSSPAASTIYANVVVKRGVSIASGSAGAVGTWLAGSAIPTAAVGSVGQYYSETTLAGINFLSYVKTDNNTWTPQPNLDAHVRSQAIQGLYNFGLRLYAQNFGTTPTLGVQITSTYNTTTLPQLRAVNLGGPDSGDYTLSISGQNAGGVALGSNTGTCPLLAADNPTGIVALIPGTAPSTVPQILFSSGANRTPHWSDATAYSSTQVNGQGYSWTYQFTIGTSGPGNSVIFSALPYITTVPSIGSAPATIQAPSGGFTDFTTFANAFVAFLNAENLALQLTASLDTVNHLITITTAVPTSLLSPNPPTSASLLPTLGSATGQYVTSVVIQGTVRGATLASKSWVFSPTYLTALENQLASDFGFNNYAYLLLAPSQYIALTTTFTWSATSGRNQLIINGNFTKIGRGFEITFDNSGGGPIYSVQNVVVSVNQGVYTTTIITFQNFTASYSSVSNTIYQLHGRTRAYTVNTTTTVPWTMFTSNLNHLTYSGAYTDASTGQYTFYSTSVGVKRFNITYWFNFVKNDANPQPNCQVWLDIYNPIIDPVYAYRTAYTNRGTFSSDNYNLLNALSWTISLGTYGSFKLSMRSTSAGTIGANIVTTPTPFEDAVFPVTPDGTSSYGGLMTVTEI